MSIYIYIYICIAILDSAILKHRLHSHRIYVFVKMQMLGVGWKICRMSGCICKKHMKKRYALFFLCKALKRQCWCIRNILCRPARIRHWVLCLSKNSFSAAKKGTTHTNIHRLAAHNSEQQKCGLRLARTMGPAKRQVLGNLKHARSVTHIHIRALFAIIINWFPHSLVSPTTYIYCLGFGLTSFFVESANCSIRQVSG